MKKHNPQRKLKQLVAGVHESLRRGQHFDVSIRAEVFAHKLGEDEKLELEEAVRDSNLYPSTEAELIALLRVHGDKITEMTARRFCAYVEAQINCDSNSTRDWVDLFVQGFPGFKTTKSVNDWLANYRDADFDDFQLFVEQVREYLE